jgi:hypothetical protein
MRMVRLLNLQSTEITFIPEINEDALLMLNDDIHVRSTSHQESALAIR